MMAVDEWARWSYSIASDVARDGLGAELSDGDEVRVEVFRCDATKTVTVSFAGERPPADVLEWFFAEAAARLEAFEDGSALPAQDAWRGI